MSVAEEKTQEKAKVVMLVALRNVYCLFSFYRIKIINFIQKHNIRISVSASAINSCTTFYYTVYYILHIKKNKFIPYLFAKT